jgi:hypothetical protein
MKSLMVSALLVFLLSGCSSFTRDWRAAAQTPGSTNDLSGRWEGSWISEVNRHEGRLRALVTKKSDMVYEARFHAKYMKILSFGYTVDLEARHDGAAFNFTGSANLGSLGGVYHYAGEAGGTNFQSTYSSKYDHGTFQMKRLF